MVFQFPEGVQLPGHVVPHGPIIILSRDGILPWSALRMALNANIVGRNVALAGRINDVGTGRMMRMLAPRPVTLFATFHSVTVLVLMS